MRNVCIAALASALLAGCASQSLLRWSSVSGTTEWKKPTLYVSSQPADPSAPLTAKTLPERAAAAYITTLGANQKDPDKLRASIATPIKKGGGGDDSNKFARVLVLGVQRNGVSPADRYTMTEIEVRPTQSKEEKGNYKNDYVFSDYQAASTTYTTINIGSVAITNQVTSSLSASPTFGAAAAPATASLGLTSTDASTHNISEQPQLSVNVQPDNATVLHTGGEGTDLAGDTLVKLALQFPVSSEQTEYILDADLIDDKGNSKPPKKASVKAKALLFVPAHDVSVCARLSYVDRHVEDGAQYRDEGKQTVDFKSGDLGWVPYPVMSQDEMHTPLWTIMGLKGGKPVTPTLELDTGLDLETVAFDDYAAATQLLKWLQKYKTGRIGRQTLFQGDVGGKGTPVTDFESLSVYPLPTLDAPPPSACPY